MHTEEMKEISRLFHPRIADPIFPDKRVGLLKSRGRGRERRARGRYLKDVRTKRGRGVKELPDFADEQY